MEAEFDKVLAVLQRYISPVNARSLLLSTLQQEGLPRSNLTREDLKRCSTSLRRGVELFVDAGRRQAALQEISQVCGNGAADMQPCVLDITVEADIGRARAEARRICDSLGASAFAMQKVATIVSELARNMVLYAGGGRVEISPSNSGRKRVVVEASDAGPGIPEARLQEVMSGRYKSRTGLGRGLLGTKQLADDFDISSSTEGTRVIAMVWV